MSSAVAEAAATAPPSARGEWWVLDRLALAWSIQAAVVLYALIGGGSWYADDYLNFGQATQHPLSLHYLNKTIFGHPEQAIRFTDWLLYQISPMNYRLASALVCLGLGFTTWLVYRILRMSFQPSPWHLVLTALLSTTGLWVPVMGWWPAAGEITGCVVCSVVIVYAMLRCQRGPFRLGWGVLAGLSLLIGLFFYERTLFAGTFAAWYLLAVSCRSARPREVLAVLRRAWSGYLALFGVSVGYLAYYTSHQFVRRHPFSHGDLLRFLWNCWGKTLVPGLFGGTLNTDHFDVIAYAGPRVWWQVLCQLALLVLFGYGLLRNRVRALLAWVVFVVIFLAGQYPIAAARLALYGPMSGQAFRYEADLMPLLVLTLGITILRRPADPAAEPEPARHLVVPADRTWLGAERRHVLTVGGALAALCLIWLITAIPAARLWTHGKNVGYAATLRRQVVERDRQGPWSLYTTFVPAFVTPYGLGHTSQTPAVARLLTDRPVSADDLSKPMFVVTEDGRIQPARMRAEATAPSTCLAKPGKRLLTLSRPLAKGLWNVQLRYQVDSPTVLRFALDPGTGTLAEATGTFRGFPISGAGQLTFPLRPTSIKAFRLDTAAAGVCVADVTIGTPVPAG